jgi:1-acyl-sn-glycerol-3-phosphate acyltransferase
MTFSVSIIPVAMIDTEKVMPVGSKMPKVRRVGVVFGEPLDFSRFSGLEGDRFVLRSITDEIMYDLSRISGQEYVDVYASSVKDRRAARKAARPAAR